MFSLVIQVWIRQGRWSDAAGDEADKKSLAGLVGEESTFSAVSDEIHACDDARYKAGVGER
jgi:hypothetical protein